MAQVFFTVLSLVTLPGISSVLYHVHSLLLSCFFFFLRPVQQMSVVILKTWVFL